jgi:hypothetical protein
MELAVASLIIQDGEKSQGIRYSNPDDDYINKQKHATRCQHIQHYSGSNTDKPLIQDAGHPYHFCSRQHNYRHEISCLLSGRSVKIRTTYFLRHIIFIFTIKMRLGIFNKTLCLSILTKHFVCKMHRSQQFAKT